jgi:hypothetical protein
MISSTEGIWSSAPQIIVLAKPYAFGINLEWSSDGSLSIAATSPCIWPNGTPPHASSEPVTPDQVMPAGSRAGPFAWARTHRDRGAPP